MQGNRIKAFIVIVLLSISGCMVTVDPYITMDSYCWDVCYDIYGYDLVGAEWHGNDIEMNITRCGCYYEWYDWGYYWDIEYVPYVVFP